LSLFNIGGRFCWASVSDLIGRKATYYTFFLLGIALYASVPWSGHAGHIALFVAAFCIILSMYGGGFSTVPAYLADIFGTQMVGAIHGRLLTAWSAAGIFGPVIVNYIREYQLDHGVARAQVYDITMYVLCVLLALGLLCNLLVRPVHEKHFMSDAEVKAETPAAREDGASGSAGGGAGYAAGSPGNQLKLGLAWLAVGIPLAWGVWMTLSKAIVLFR
jgi:MFS family permease